MATTEESELGRRLNALRRNTKNAGRKKKLRKCPGCGLKLGARERQAHKCPAKVAQ